MIRHIKQYLAIRSYMMRLSQDMARRFDRRPFYSIEQVKQAVERDGYSTVFIAYAHAAFCNEKDFADYYGPLGVACSYGGLRRTIARRYFAQRMDFDAETIIVRFRHGEYYGGNQEFGGGDSLGGSHW